MEPIEDIIVQGEGEMLEFKPSFNQDVVETASAFANTRGGRVLVGVSNTGESLGLPLSEEALRDYVNRISNATEPSVIPDAVCHRDYGDLADIQIKVYDQSLQIWSPGFLPFGMSVEELLRPNHSSKPRNRLIAQAFYDMGMIEQYGSGIGRVRTACAEAGLPEPEFENFSGGFQVVFKPLGLTGAKATQQVTAQVTAQVAAFCREPRAAKEIMTELELKHWKTFQSNYLKPLLNAGILEMTQPDSPKSPTQKYRLTGKGKQLLNNEQ